MSWLLQPVFCLGIKAAVPCAVCSACIKYLGNEDVFGQGALTSLLHHSAFSSFTLLISLFVAFRASHAYTRFWAGTQALFAISSGFFDVASSLFAFSRNSKQSAAKVSEFRQLVVRLFSVLHALILADLEAEGQMTGEEKALKFELIDVAGIDDGSIELLKQAGPRRIDLVFQWLQSLVVEGQQSELLPVPAPILSRVFQELNTGMMDYHKALSLAEVSFPVPYTAATHFVLVLHWVLTPIMASTWSSYVWSASLLAFVQVFMLWSLNAIAQELENPFGSDISDLDTCGYHCALNERLIFLLGTGGQKVPTLSLEAVVESQALKFEQDQARKSLITWFEEREERKSKCGMHKNISDDLLHQADEPQCHLHVIRRTAELKQPELASRESSTCDLQVVSGNMDVQQSELATRDSTCRSTGSEQIMEEWQPVHHDTTGHADLDSHPIPNPYNSVSACTDGTTAMVLPSTPKKLHKQQCVNTDPCEPTLSLSLQHDELQTEAAGLKTSYL